MILIFGMVIPYLWSREDMDMIYDLGITMGGGEFYMRLDFVTSPMCRDVVRHRLLVSCFPLGSLKERWILDMSLI